MKFTIVLLLSLIAVSSGSFGGEPDDVSPDVIPAVHDFEFRVEIREKAAVLETVHGTNWIRLSWGSGDDGPLEFWIDESGIATRQEDLVGSQFLIHFRESVAGSKLVSSGGTSWSELVFGCGEPGVCRYMVNENGVQGL